jgi:hypothetical protein
LYIKLQAFTKAFIAQRPGSPGHQMHTLHSGASASHQTLQHAVGSTSGGSFTFSLPASVSTSPPSFGAWHREGSAAIKQVRTLHVMLLLLQDGFH